MRASTRGAKGAASAGQKYTPTAMLERLVSFDTTSHRSNLALVEFISHYLAAFGVDARLTFDEARQKANFLASIGPAVEGGVVLSGHLDVVPATADEWDADPFLVVHRNGRLYGRGTADMKGFIAVVLGLVPEFLAVRLLRPIHLAFSYDEEIGCRGVHSLLRQIAGTIPRPALAIVGEPSGMRIINAHKGVRHFTTTVIGRDGHSSDPAQGVNAIIFAADVVRFLNELGDEWRRRPNPPEHAGVVFEPPYSTLNVGTISGGTIQNVIARECAIRWETRLVPWHAPDEAPKRLAAFAEEQLLPRMHGVDRRTGIETVMTCDVPGLKPNPDSPAEALCRKLLGANRSYSVSFGSEAGLFQQAGIPTVICGPGHIAQAHRPNEFVELTQLETCTAFLRRLTSHLCSA